MKYFDEYLSDLKTLISFNSVKGEKSADAPFGEENKKALEFFLQRAKDFGFETINYDNYIGEIVFGEGEEIGIIGHLDIVPVGDIGWETPPLTLVEKDGFLFGRGVSDDKGPTLLNLYVLRELKENGFIPDKKIRFFAGCNEESGWADIDYFKTKSSFPEYGYSPDGTFPLTYAEKGIYQIKFCLPAFKNFTSIKGGVAINAVCAYATAIPTEKGIDTDLLQKHNLVLKDNVIESYGKAAHGSAPHLGKNAIKPLLEYFADMGEKTQHVIDFLFNDKANLFGMITEQGKVTLSPNVIEQQGDKVFITCDCRIPAPLTIDDVLKVVDTFNLEYTLLPHSLEPMMVEKDGWFVQALLSSYNQITGETGKPISMGGSTFARAFKKGCSFGFSFIGRYNHFAHDANERISIADVEQAYEIYKTAIIKLAKK